MQFNSHLWPGCIRLCWLDIIFRTYGCNLNMAGSSSSVQKKSRAKSCTRCRQAKLACDARSTLTEPCSRCKSKNFDCHFDANFKRISTRKWAKRWLAFALQCAYGTDRLTEEISQELHAARSASQVPQPDRTDLSAARTFVRDTTLPESGQARSSSVLVPSSTNALCEQTSPWLSIADSDTTRSYCLGKVELESEVAIELIQQYVLDIPATDQGRGPKVVANQPSTTVWLWTLEARIRPWLWYSKSLGR